MKKLYIFSFLLVMSVLCAHAEQVTPSEAKQKAAEFLNSTAPANAPRRAKAITATTLLQVWPVATNTAGKVRLKAPATNTGADYYIFNTADSTAFVVVSGESTTRSILAYSTEGFFNMADIAPGAQYLLDGYAEQIEMVKSGKAVAKADEPVLYADGGKLLETAKFNQGTPYNNLCPSVGDTKCVTGCTATAMAIAMKYHNWPTTGVGSNSYVTGTHKFPLSADFNTTYDWDNILTAYDSYYDYTQQKWLIQGNSTQHAAVAKLLYHCGVAVNMNYDTGGSGGSDYDACKVLKVNFKYSRSTRYVSHSKISANEWWTMLKTEIDSNRPVMVRGDGDRGPHEFICDGYDPNGLFHYNMGWGGSSSGYYEDGVISYDHYTLTDAIIGIKPATTDELNSSVLCMGANNYGDVSKGLTMNVPSNVIKDIPFSITPHDIGTLDRSKFTGLTAAALYTQSGTLRRIISDTLSWTDVSSLYLNPASVSCTVPSSVNMAPTDRIWYVSSTDNGATWKKIYCYDEETSSVAVSGYPDVNVAVTWNTHETGVTIGNKKDSFVYPNTYTFTVTKPDNKKAVILRVNGTIMQPASTDGNVDTYTYTPTGTTVEFDLSSRSELEFKTKYGTPYGLAYDMEANVTQNTNFILKANYLGNGSGATYSGTLGCGLYGNDGTLKEVIYTYENFSLSGYYKSWSIYNAKVTTSNLAVDDRIYLISSTDGGKTWAQVAVSDGTENWLPVSGYPDVNVAVTWNTHETGVTIGNKKDSFVYPNTYTFTVTKPDNKKAVILRTNGTVVQPASTDGNVDTYAYTPTETTVEFDLSNRSELEFKAYGTFGGLAYSTEANMKKNSYFNLKANNLGNGSGATYSGTLGCGLYGNDGTLKEVIYKEGSFSLSNNSTRSFSRSCKVTTSNLAVDDRIYLISSTDGGKTWAQVAVSDGTENWLPVSGYPGVFFCQGHNGQDAYVYGDVTDDVKSQLAAQADVTRIDLTDATQSSAFDLTGVNPNAYAEGTTAAITGALTKSLTAVSLTDNKPYYADGTHNVSSVTYTRVFNADNAQSTSANTLWQTICLPFDVSRVMFGDKPFDIMDYWLYEVTEDGLTRVRTGNIQANKPYVIAFANASQYGELSVSGEVTFTGNGVLQTADMESDVYTTGNYKTVAYYGPTTSNAAYYALDTAGDHFVSGDNVQPFHPYAVVPGETNPVKGRSLNIFDGQTTGIEEISSNTVAGSQMTIVPVSGGVEVTATRAGSVSVVAPNGALLGVFSVSEGTKLIKLPVGLFIVNGKKIMVK